MPRVLADFGRRGVVLVDDADHEALKDNRYRLDCYGVVVRSLPGKRSRSLAQDVGDLMGLPADRLVTFRDGNQLNATRANLTSGQLRGVRTMPRIQRSQPPGVHRVRMGAPRRGESSAPPRGYAITYHEPPCAPDNPVNPGQAWTGCLLARDARFIGTAVRITATTRSGRPKPAGWDVRAAGGERTTFANFFDGVEGLLALYLAGSEVAA